MSSCRPMIKKKFQREIDINILNNNSNKNTADELTLELLSLKDTFTQVLNSVCHAIEKDCGELKNEEKRRELAKIKIKYTNLREEVSRLLSELTLASPVTKEERSAIQEALYQCMSYLGQLHNNMELILKKYEGDGIHDVINDKNKCCDKDNPHLHNVFDGNHIIIQLKKGTHSEVEYVNRLMNNVNCLPDEKKRIAFDKICNLNAADEFGGGDELNKYLSTNSFKDVVKLHIEKKLETEQNICEKEKVEKIMRNNVNVASKEISLISDISLPGLSFSGFSIPRTIKQKVISTDQPTVQPQNIDKCNNWYIPEKIMESLLDGYCKSNLEIQENKKKTLVENSKVSHPNDDQLLNENKKMEELNKTIYDSQLLHIYDSRGIPLTDGNGVPLNNIAGKCLVIFKNRLPISTLDNEPIFDHNLLPFVKRLDEPLYDVRGASLRIYNREGVPLTDENGYISRLVNGKYAVQLDHYNRITSDALGRPIYNNAGEQITIESAKLPSRQTSNMDVIICGDQPLLYNDKGFLLTNANGLPLHDSQGRPLIKKDPTSGALTDNVGSPIYDSQGSVYSGLVEKKKSILTLYDHNKYPLTGYDGRVLRNASGKEMVICDNKGNPIKDCMSRLIYDASGIPSTNPNFKAYSKKLNCKKEKFVKLGTCVYDFRGYPLVDSNGVSLSTSDGRELILLSDIGEITDLNGRPVYDKVGIPLTKLKKCWKTPTNKPYRVFDITGFPLTSDKGEDLYDINGNELLKKDNKGRPIMTQTGCVVYDANGILATQPEFNPSQSPTNNSPVSRKLFTNKKPMIVYNRNGKPLIDPAGMGMVNSKGKDLLTFDLLGLPVQDSNGDNIYDKHKIPLNCQQNKPIISMSGKPFRIYDKQGRPLTDITGTPLNLANGMCIIKFDNAGRPMCDFKNSPLYDFFGRVLQDTKANPEYANECDSVKLTKRDGKPMLVFNGDGLPLTDSVGRVLVNADGTHLQLLNNERVPVSDYNGDLIYDAIGQPLTKSTILEDNIPDTITDVFGRLLRDACGEPQFDRYGRPLYDLYRRRLYDFDERPISNAYGMFLTTGKPEPREIDLGFDPIILKSPSKLEENQLLTDLIGGPLFDRVGLPLYNEYGKPLIDIYGRSLYDVNGQPLCDQAGTPMSDLVRKAPGTPIEIKDMHRPIELTKEIAEVIDGTIIRNSRTSKFSSSNIPGIWKLAPERSHNNDQVHVIDDNSMDKIMYWAFLRITTFDDGKKLFEILEAKPMVVLDKTSLSE